MFNLSKETLIAGVTVVVAIAGLTAGDIAVSNYLVKRRVAALLEELKPIIEDFYGEVYFQEEWSDMDEATRIQKIERLIAHDILNITNTYDPKVVVHLRQAVSDEIKKIITR